MDFAEIKKELDENTDLYIEFCVEYSGNLPLQVCICKICGAKYSDYWNNIVLNRTKSHILKKHKGSLTKELLKPWEAPNSLFCDTMFLEKPIKDGGMGLNIRKGEQCND